MPPLNCAVIVKPPDAPLFALTCCDMFSLGLRASRAATGGFPNIKATRATWQKDELINNMLADTERGNVNLVDLVEKESTK